jgi:Short C-terminal domain
MPGLLRGIARTAVVAGTATAVSNRVSRRQANRWQQRQGPDPQSQPQPAYQQPAPQYAPPPPPQYAPPPASDPIQQLKDLADLKAQGILTEEEFAAQKARILRG